MILTAMYSTGTVVFSVHSKGQSAPEPCSKDQAKAMLDELPAATLINLADELCKVAKIELRWTNLASDICTRAVADVTSRVLKNGPIVFKDLRPDGIFKGPDGKTVEVPTVKVPLLAKEPVGVTSIVSTSHGIMVNAQVNGHFFDQPADVGQLLVDLHFMEILALADFVSIL